MKALMNNNSSSKGFTLVEVLISLAISGLLIILFMKSYSTAISGYSLQGEIVEMNQNGKYVIKEITEILAQAGADCANVQNSTTDMDTIVKLTGSGPVYNEFTIKFNPRGGFHILTTTQTFNTTTVCSLSVKNASKFMYATKLARIPKAGATDSTIKVYTLNSVDTANNRLRFSGGTSSSETFSAGDAVYSFVNNRYFLNGTNFCLNDAANVLAENIKVFKVVFYDAIGDSTFSSSLAWKKMHAANVVVIATTSPKLPAKKQQQITFSNQFKLRNKVE
jgi:prepilin-type N-terminal cleavage/methylation domain-containing protein